MESIKEFFKKHQDTIYTLAFLLLLDEFVFDGKFRERIKGIMDGMVKKMEKKVLEDK